MVLLKVFLSTSALSLSMFAQAASKANFETRKVSLNEKIFTVWVAKSEAERAQGMMYKTEWPKNIKGMLFIFEGERRRSFWMKNTHLPLSLGYFDKGGVLLETADMNPPKSLAQVKVDRSVSARPAKYVLEVSQGWLKKQKVKVGAKLRLL